MKGIVVDMAVRHCESVEIERDANIHVETIEKANWPQRLVLPRDTQCVTIKVSNCFEQNAGILASFSNGNVTDGSWKCTDSTSCDWETQNCSSDAWKDASVVANNGAHSTSTKFQEIASNAQWIWISHSLSISVWCKKTFGKFKLK